MTYVNGEDANDARWVLPKRLRRGLREALDAGHGKLRMDPQDLANLLSKAIDQEVARLLRIRQRREKERQMQAAFAAPEKYFAGVGHAAGTKNTAKFENPVE